MSDVDSLTDPQLESAMVSIDTGLRVGDVLGTGQAADVPRWAFENPRVLDATGRQQMWAAPGGATKRRLSASNEPRFIVFTNSPSPQMSSSRH